MLTESFIASIASGTKSAASNSLPKDASIFLHDYQPRASLVGTLKKSSTNPHSLAVTTTHIFAAQSDKALIHVYSREKGNQETIVPFPERITSLVRIGPEDGLALLALGTENGGIMIWELCTGRLVSTPPTHLQPVTCLAVDPTNNFLLSGSSDSEIYVWSIPGLISFTEIATDEPGLNIRTSSLRSFSNHRAGITSLATGHSHSTANFALSASEDETCIVWDYRTGNMLHTFLLPTTPLCLTLDPADRGFYAGLEDGSVQMVNFHASGSSIHLLYDKNLTSTPTQPLASDRWTSDSALGKPLSMAVSYDGTSLITGHESGKIMAWQVGTGLPPQEISDLGQAVTNLLIVPPTGFPNERKSPSGATATTVIKPRPDAFPYGEGSGLSVPANYTLAARFEEVLHMHHLQGYEGDDALMADFDAALAHPSFPPAILQAAAKELESANNTDANGNGYPAQEGMEQLRGELKLAESKKVEALTALTELKAEIQKRDKLAEMKRRAKSLRRIKKEKKMEAQRKKYMGEPVEDEVEDENMKDEHPELSEDTDELTASD